MFLGTTKVQTSSSVQRFQIFWLLNEFWIQSQPCLGENLLASPEPAIVSKPCDFRPAVVTYALCKLSRRKQKCPRIYLSLGEIGFEIAQQCSTLVVIVKVPIGFFISGVRVIVHSEIAAVVRQLDRVFFESDPLRKH